MKRRTFITSSVGLAGLSACSTNPDSNNSLSVNIEYAEDKPVELLKELENSSLKFRIFSNASIVILDKKNDASWETWPVAIQDKGVVEEGHVWLRTGRSITEQYPGRFQGELKGDNIEFTLIGLQKRIIGQFLINISLENDWLVYNILEVGDTIPSLVFPPPIKSEAIIIPKGVGEIIRDTEGSQIYGRTIYPFYTRLNMRFIGGTKGNASWIGIFDEGFEDAYGLFANRTASPLWARSLGTWRHGFTYRMKFLQGNYVNVAREYRKWFKDQGKFKSLEEKKQENSQLDSFLGGRAFWISLCFPKVSDKTGDDLLLTEEQKLQRGPNPVNIRFTYKELAAMIEKLKSLGLEKGFIKIAGWINGGYDYSHQDVWPPEPSLGEVSELKELLAMERPLMSGLHDNNQDIYPHTKSFPDGVIRNANGEFMTGGIWAGGQTYILGSRASLKYAKHNWEQIKTIQPKAMFVDIITALNLYQSFEKGNKLTKHEDLQAKCDMMQFYKDQGILLGSEESADFGIPYLDWYENRHSRIQSTSIPLWPLVFHDAAFNTRYGGVTRNEGYPGWLEDMLWGYLPHFSINPGWDQDELFTSIDHVDKWHEKVGMADMVDHKFLTNDLNVEQAEFSTGESIICNFSEDPVHIDGKLIKSGGYLIES
ncbi:DUF5696 domain-containing protein [Bacteroidota bacterium]